MIEDYKEINAIEKAHNLDNNRPPLNNRNTKNLKNDVSHFIYEIGGFTELNFFEILNKCGSSVE